MRHPQIQFFDFNQGLGTYVCQFADRTDPRVTARFTALTLPELKIMAVEWLEYHIEDAGERREQLERLDNLCNRLAEKEREQAEKRALREAAADATT